MKKTIAILCAGIIACTAASCGNNIGENEDISKPAQTETAGEKKTEQPSDIKTASDKTETEADTDSKAERSADEDNTKTEADADMENSQ